MRKPYKWIVTILVVMFIVWLLVKVDVWYATQSAQPPSPPPEPQGQP